MAVAATTANPAAVTPRRSRCRGGARGATASSAADTANSPSATPRMALNAAQSWWRRPRNSMCRSKRLARGWSRHGRQATSTVTSMRVGTPCGAATRKRKRVPSVTPAGTSTRTWCEREHSPDPAQPVAPFGPGLAAAAAVPARVAQRHVERHRRPGECLPRREADGRLVCRSPGLVAEEARRACAPRRRRSTGSRSRSHRRSRPRCGRRREGGVQRAWSRRAGVVGSQSHVFIRPRVLVRYEPRRKLSRHRRRCYDRALS